MDIAGECRDGGVPGALPDGVVYGEAGRFSGGCGLGVSRQESGSGGERGELEEVSSWE